jgi:hypothetical protein
MHWKKVKGRQYLFRSMDRHGYGKSLGVRSPETDAVFRDFHENKKRIKENIHELQNRLRSQARFCKAARQSKPKRPPKDAQCVTIENCAFYFES